MTPYAIHLLLTMHANTPIPSEVRRKPIYDIVVRELVEQGVLEASNPPGRDPRLSELGRAYLDLLCHTPLPVKIWVDPRTQPKTA